MIIQSIPFFQRRRLSIYKTKKKLGVDPTDDPLWTPSDEYTCKQCGAKNCMYKMTQITGRKVIFSVEHEYC